MSSPLLFLLGLLCQALGRPATCVVGGWAFTVLENGFPVVFEFEFEQIKASTDHSKSMAFSVRTAWKPVMKTESHSRAFPREGNVAPASKVVTAQEARSGLTRVNTQAQNKRKVYTVQPGPGTERRRDYRQRLANQSSPSGLFKTFKKDNFHGF